MKTWTIGLVAVALMFGGCSQKEDKPLVISSDMWIGATPLYYAHAKGWLKKANIEMLQVGSIEANLNLYETHATDFVTATQYEYKRLLKTHPDLIPQIIYDRSYGGDMILSNRTVQQLKASTDKIDLLVEFNTVGEDMFNYFLAANKMKKDKFNVLNRNQDEIELAPNSPNGGAVVAVTYNPHDLVLKEHGFKEIANSRNDEYVVIDGIYCTRAIAKEHKDQLKVLKKLIEKSVEAYSENPKEFYKTVKPYLGHPSYEEFENMRENVQWIQNEKIPDVMKQKMVDMHYPISELIN